MNNQRAFSLPAFLHKEWRELFKQSRVFIILAPLVIFAILDPVMLKLLPKILASQMQQMQIAMPAIKAADAMANYLKDVSQLSVFVFVLATMGVIAEERASGAYLILFSRRVQRWQAVLAKFIVNGTTVAAGLLIGLITARYYIGVLFGGALPFGRVLAAAGLALVYYLFLLGILLLLSALFKRGFVAGIVTLVTAMLMPLLGYIPKIGRYLPHVLFSAASATVTTGAAPAGTGVAIAVALILAALGVAGAGLALERAEL